MIKFTKNVHTSPPATAAGKSPFDQVRQGAAEKRRISRRAYKADDVDDELTAPVRHV